MVRKNILDGCKADGLKSLWKKHCLCMHIVSVYTHTPPLKDQLLGLVYAQLGIFGKQHKKPAAHLKSKLQQWCETVLLLCTAEGGWYVRAAVLNPNRSLGAGDASLVQVRSCFNIQNKVLWGKVLPPFVLCSWGIIGIWQPVLLTPHSILKASQLTVLLGSAVWCLRLLRTSPSFLTWFGQMKWPNTIENPVDLPFNL